MKIIEVNSGDTVTIKLTARTKLKVAIDISSYTSASLKIAKALNISNNDALYYTSVLSANFTDGVNGIHSFIINEDVAKEWTEGEYLLQTRLIDASGAVTSGEIEQVRIKTNLIDDEA